MYWQIRRRMTRSEVSSKSRIIGRRLLNEVDWNKYPKICVYEPIEELNEADIGGVISRLKAQRRNVELIPKTKNPALPRKKFDLIIVPCLAYDRANYRLGWGGGFYDKFLARQPQALKIGVCFDNGLVESGLPRDRHDVPVDRIVTESQELAVR